MNGYRLIAFWIASIAGSWLFAGLLVASFLTVLVW